MIVGCKYLVEVQCDFEALDSPNRLEAVTVTVNYNFYLFTTDLSDMLHML